MDAVAVELYLLGSLLPAVVAHRKGRDFIAWWIYGVCLWIIAVPHAFLLTPNQETLDQRRADQGWRKCPACAEMVRREALICRYCGRDLPPLPQPAPMGSATGPSRWEPFNRPGIAELEGARVPGRAIALDRRRQLVRFHPDAEPDHSQGRTYD